MNTKMSVLSRLTRRELLFAAPALKLAAAGSLRVGVFRADATPPKGEPLIWVVPLEETLDPLLAKGIILSDGRERVVFCAIDWCGLGGAAFRQFQHAIARAAGVRPSRVILQCVHQHAAPYVDGDAYRLLRAAPDTPLCFSEAGMREIAGRLAEAVRKASSNLVTCDRIGIGQAKVERVASARRVWDQGKLLVRYSSGGKDPRMAALPEGPIDPWLKTISFAHGDRPIARLHFYATHPQTFCCDGKASADFVGEARERWEREEGVAQIYFTGCAGDVTVGKYNDGSTAARRELASRLYAGLKAASAATELRPVARLAARTVPLRLPPRAPSKPFEDIADPTLRYRTAITHAFARRKEPLEITAIDLGGVRILHLPGEPLLEFQLFAQRLLPDEFVAAAGYGDISPGYVCPDRAFEEGGYEPSASNHLPGGESLVKDAIRRALGA
jgi:hypothetical protein